MVAIGVVDLIRVVKHDRVHLERHGDDGLVKFSDREAAVSIQIEAPHDVQ